MAAPPIRAAHVADLTFRIDTLAAEDLRVVDFVGQEGLSELFRFDVHLCSDDSRHDPEVLLGKPCRLEIGGYGGTRYVHGIVLAFERAAEGVDLTYYRAEIGPAFWLLTKRQRSRVFIEARCPQMTVPGIIEKVFKDAGIPADRYRFALEADYDTHEFLTQYRETDMDFVSRLMEREGIFYFFEQTADGQKMVIADSPVAHVHVPGVSEYVYRDPNGLVSDANQEHFYSVRNRSRIQSGSVVLDDYNYLQPRTQLRTKINTDKYTALEIIEYPGDYCDSAVGKRYARVRLEEQLCRRVQAELTGTVRALAPGFKFTLADHPCEALNREYLVTRLAHQASQPQSAGNQAGDDAQPYIVEVTAIPSDHSFRPARQTPRPFVRGSQTALVVGPPGEEIYTDKYGRVKVQFHWDQEGEYDPNSSCWIRVSHGSAGGQYGMMFLPRVGQEVVVDFLEGDPDCPIITGSVHNNDLMPPYALPEEKTKSVIKTHSSKGGGGTNEIRFEDLKDNEQLLIYAQKDFHVHVNNDRVETVDKNRHLTVKENQYELVKQEKHAEVKLDLSETVGGKRSLLVKGDLAEETKGNHFEKVGSNLYIKAGSNVVIESGAAITLKVGGNFVKVDASGVTIQGSLVKINSPGGVAGMGSPIALKSPESPVEADQVTPGQDVAYSGDPYATDPLAEQQRITGEVVPPSQVAKKTSWIEIEMVDETGQPWPNERYEITTPDGRVIKGRLNAQGQARVSVKDPGSCQISFPDLDGRAWERLG
jgi:type VI secretion system secreted protein VgrG